MDFKEIESILEKAEISVIDSVIDDNKMVNIVIINIENFIKIAKAENIRFVFKDELRKDYVDYTINTDDVVNKYGENIWEILKPKIDTYNSKVDAVDFDRPTAIRLIFIKDSVMYNYVAYDDWFDELEFEQFDVAIDSIFDDNLDEIEESQREVGEEREQLRVELRDRIFEDAEFKVCTNKSLRSSYASMLVEKSWFNKYRKCFISKTSGRFLVNKVHDFIEMSWGIYKENK